MRSLDPCGSASGLSAPRMLNAPSPRAEDAELVFWEEAGGGAGGGARKAAGKGLGGAKYGLSTTFYKGRIIITLVRSRAS